MKSLLRQLWLGIIGSLLWPIVIAQTFRSTIDHAIGRGRPVHPRRVLVMRFGLLGDGLLLIPALRDLRARLNRGGVPPEIDLLASPFQAPLFAELLIEGTLTRVIPWQAGDLTELHRARHLSGWQHAWSTLVALRTSRYDLAVSCYGRLGSAIAVLAGIPDRVGLRSEAFAGTLTRVAEGVRYEPGRHESTYNLAVVAMAAPHAGKATDGHRLHAGESVANTLTTFGLPTDGRPFVVLHPGATNGAAKRWPLPSWRSVALTLLQGGTTVAVIGGPEDRHLGATICRDLAGPIHDLTGRTSLPDLVDIVAGAAVVVTGDSGPLHLAVALARPVVAIHGPTDPAICGPIDTSGDRVVILQASLPCQPCYTLARPADCPLGHAVCQVVITPTMVVGSIARLGVLV